MVGVLKIERAKMLKREEVSRVLPKKSVANLVDTVNGKPLKRKVAEKKSLERSCAKVVGKICKAADDDEEGNYYYEREVARQQSGRGCEAGGNYPFNTKLMRGMRYKGHQGG